MVAPEEIDSIFIVGPTASGKSDLAMRLAVHHEGEIVCADSQTVRRGLDIGAAKPTLNERHLVRHHLLDIIDPYDSFSASEFKTLAEQAIEEIRGRSNLPIVVGGTGLYVDALLYDFRFRKSSSKYSRKMLESLSVKELHKIIDNGDLPMPENTQNPRHLIRTIESGGQISKKAKKRKGSIIIGVDPGKEVLDSRIQERIRKMLQEGFLEEVDEIIKQYGEPSAGFDAIGYKIALECRDDSGRYDKDELARRFAQADRNYAKRQRSWFRRSKDIVWFEHVDAAYLFLNKLLQMH